MATIFKHTFFEERIAVENGELVMLEPLEHTYHFSLKMKGTDLFEQEYGKPLLPVITKALANTQIDNPKNIESEDIVSLLNNSDALLEGKMIKALAVASYIKIDGAQAYNNEQTALEFKESPVYSLVTSDFEFIGELFSMAIDCLMDSQKESEKGKKLKKNKNEKAKN